MINWVFWGVPPLYIKKYVFWMFMILFGLPYFCVFYYTKLGVVINLLWYDMIFYGYVRIKEKIKENLDEGDRME